MAKHGHKGEAQPDVWEKHKVIKSGWHHSFGWLRRPELDDREMNLWAYEEPNGDHRMSSDPRHERAAYLDLWEAPGGERYFAFSVVPRTKA
jgi:hypothetical protein